MRFKTAVSNFMAVHVQASPEDIRKELADYYLRWEQRILPQWMRKSIAYVRYHRWRIAYALYRLANDGHVKKVAEGYVLVRPERTRDRRIARLRKAFA